MSVLVAVTDHAAERFRQRIGGRSGEVDPRAEIVRRVAEAHAAGRVSDEPPPGATAARGSVYVRDLVDRSLVFVCRQDGAELVVITLWEMEGGPAAAAGPAAVHRRAEAAGTLTSSASRVWRAWASRRPSAIPRALGCPTSTAIRCARVSAV